LVTGINRESFSIVTRDRQECFRPEHCYQDPSGAVFTLFQKERAWF
jgi:hypothetical protein